MSPAGAPRGRGIPLAERDEEIQYWLARFEGDAGVAGAWERAVAAPPWDGQPVWHHGDLDVRNWLVRDGRIRGVIDWGSMGVGDPACDDAYTRGRVFSLFALAARNRRRWRPGSTDPEVVRPGFWATWTAWPTLTPSTGTASATWFSNGWGFWRACFSGTTIGWHGTQKIRSRSC